MITILDGSVIITTPKSIKLFRSVNQADKYYQKQDELKNNPCWTRVLKHEFVNQHGTIKTGH
jgi:hypothetical protein